MVSGVWILPTSFSLILSLCLLCESRVCPRNYTFALTSCYRVHRFHDHEERSWSYARVTCIREQADLVSINTQVEDDLVEMIRKESGIADTSFYWIGLSDMDDEGIYRWVDGSNATFTKWARGEPTSHNPTITSSVMENYVLASGLHKWSDVTDQWRSAINRKKQPVGFICESPSSVMMTARGGKVYRKLVETKTSSTAWISSARSSVKGQKGEVGQTGPRGQKGGLGPKGMTGPRGLQGSKGEPGFPGVRGLPGKDAIDLLPALARVKGTSGPRGLPGTPGTPGLQGKPGSQGPPGMRGLMGPPGSAGPRGLPGSIGLTGSPGIPGHMGLRGFTGVSGARGDPGVPGEIGPSGPTGPVGEKGVRGDKGDSGTPGRTGPMGPHGLTGATGAPGLDGLPGAPGSPGPPAPTGKTGDVGPRGVAGVKGDAGSRGATGPRGRPGRNGVAGAIGLPGPPGPPWNPSRGDVERLQQLLFYTYPVKMAAKSINDTTVELTGEDTMDMFHFFSLYSTGMALLYLAVVIQGGLLYRLYRSKQKLWWPPSSFPWIQNPSVI